MKLSSLAQAARDLNPAYFALVMATGIVATAVKLEGLDLAARALTWVNLAAFIILLVLTFRRMAFCPRFLRLRRAGCLAPDFLGTHPRHRHVFSPAGP